MLKVARPTAPSPGEVAVYTFPLDHEAAIARCREVLSRDEVERAGRFAYPALRERYVVGRGGLRLLLGAILDQRPERLRFAYGQYGKPSLPDSGLHFNLSHSEGLAALAVTHAAEVGADVEAIRAFAFDELASHCFSPPEQVAFGAVPTHDRAHAFYRCWTRKEAVLKAAGAGLYLPLDAFDVSLECDAPRVLRYMSSAEPTDWTLLHMAPAPGFVGAVAVRAAGVRLTCRAWSMTEALALQDGCCTHATNGRSSAAPARGEAAVVRARDAAMPLPHGEL